MAPARAVAPYRPIELSSDSCEVPTEGSSQCRSPHWAQSAVLLEEPRPQLLCRETHTQKPRSLHPLQGAGPILRNPPVCAPPPAPRPVGLGFRPSCLSLKGGFLLGPWFLLLPAPTWFGRLRLWRPGFRARMPEASGQPGLSPSHLTHFNLGQITKMLCASSSSSAG